MTDELTPAELVYQAIESLPGWNAVLRDARDSFSQQLRGQVGALLSSVLLATEDGDRAIAIGGTIDEDGAGYLAIVASTGVVVVKSTKISAQETSYAVRAYAFREVRDVQLGTRHSYFSGTEQAPRNTGVSLSFTVDGQAVAFDSRFSRVPLVGADAVLNAFRAVRDSGVPHSGVARGGRARRMRRRRGHRVILRGNSHIPLERNHHDDRTSYCRPCERAR